MIAGWSRSAYAHPAPAEPPIFAQADCVTVVDTREQAYLDIAYRVANDDTEIQAGDIPLPDFKTHQFFAIAGSVFPNGAAYRSYLFDELEAARAIDVPLWITAEDVARAAKAVAEAEGVTFSDTDVPADAVLEHNLALQGKWFRITPDTDRRPIRVDLSLRPVRWNLQGVAPGAYTVAGYVFSPPYNDWTIRPGVVKVKDAEHDAPAGSIASIKESVFAYEGRRIAACVDVPAGTRLDAYYLTEDNPSQGWRAWLSDQPVESGNLDLCFHTDEEQMAGSLRVRLDLTSPDGAVVTLHSRDTITWLQGRGGCEEDDTKCCTFAGALTKDAFAAMEAESASPVEVAPSAGRGASEPATPPSSGCGVTLPAAHGSQLAGLVVLAAWLARRRRTV